MEFLVLVVLLKIYGANFERRVWKSYIKNIYIQLLTHLVT